MPSSSLGWNAARFFTSAHDAEPPEFASRYEALVDRRIRREPLAYIVGQQEFWGLPFEVSPAVLIPRPETELIVEAALELFPRGQRHSDARRPVHRQRLRRGGARAPNAQRRGLPRPTSRRSRSTSRGRTRARLGVAGRIDFRCADLLEGLDGPFDLIVCNPPYVAERDKPGLQPEVRDHEPASRCSAAATDSIWSSGWSRRRRDISDPADYLLFEFGFGQDDRVESLIADTAGLRLVELRRDLQGIARTAVVERP